MPQYDWKFLFSVPWCHRWFRDRTTGRVAACDESGATPDMTDDGVLWLPVDCLIRRRRQYDDGEWYDEVEIPLIRPDGTEVWLGGTSSREAAELVNRGLARYNEV